MRANAEPQFPYQRPDVVHSLLYGASRSRGGAGVPRERGGSKIRLGVTQAP